MLQSVFDLGDTIVREVMVPRTEVVWIEEDKTLRQALHLADRSGFSRDPGDRRGRRRRARRRLHQGHDRQGARARAGERGPDAGRGDAGSGVRPRVQERRRAVARDAARPQPFRRSSSTSTAAPPASSPSRTCSRRSSARSPTSTTRTPRRRSSRCADGVVRVSARLPVEDLGELFDVELPNEDVETVGGLLAQLLGRVPLPGIGGHGQRPAAARRVRRGPPRPAAGADPAGAPDRRGRRRLRRGRVTRPGARRNSARRTAAGRRASRDRRRSPNGDHAR